MIDTAEVVRLYQSGTSARSIASALGSSASVIVRLLHAEGVDLRPPGRHKLPLVTTEDVPLKPCRRCKRSLPLDHYFPDKKAGLYARCKECHTDLTSRYRSENRDRLQAIATTRRRERYAEDAQFRVGVLLRNRVSAALQGRARAASTSDLVGCDLATLRLHLEVQFVDGMTWDNYGVTGWHVDHIRPCASFDLSDPAQQRECFHYTNLQPLWAVDNCRKGART